MIGAIDTVAAPADVKLPVSCRAPTMAIDTVPAPAMAWDDVDAAANDAPADPADTTAARRMRLGSPRTSDDPTTANDAPAADSPAHVAMLEPSIDADGSLGTAPEDHVGMYLRRLWISMRGASMRAYFTTSMTMDRTIAKIRNHVLWRQFSTFPSVAPMLPSLAFRLEPRERSLFRSRI